MVKINAYHQRENDDKEIFYVLEVLGNVEFIQSQNSGQTYATRRKVYIPTTFDEEACKDLIGQTLPGKIIKQACEEYEYTIKDTGEIVTLDYTYVYSNEEKETVSKNRPSWASVLDEEESFEADTEVFSDNGLVEA